jgi:uncharacterized protein YdeI (YjbR/CyaY-like superfamily)
MEKTLYVKTRDEWRRWLESNHKKKSEIWLVYYKKHTGKPRISYDDAVEEALCFGWIDSIVKRVDDERFMQKFTPRREKSVWSAHNKKRALKLIREGRMTDAGLARVDEAKKSGAWNNTMKRSESQKMPVELERALAADKTAGGAWGRLTPSQRKLIAGWVADAKKEETRSRRASKAVVRLKEGKKTVM